jgi:hypothetical protein
MKRIREGLKEALARNVPDLNQKRSLQAKFLKHGKLKSMPGTRLFVAVSAQYILEKLDEYANVASNGFALRPKFKRSDIADLTHVFYCPYVDVFGCDGPMRERLRRVDWRGDNIVTGDPELEQKLGDLARTG